jgi:hypothetical protein
MDFLLTPSGDITFEMYERKSSPFNISFITSKTKALTISFHTDSSNSIHAKNTSLTINFSTYNPSNDKAISMTTSDEYYEQQIRLRLLTAIGDMKSYKELGSKIEIYKHKIMDSLNLEQSLHDEILRAIKDIIPNCELVIELKKDIYYGYSNCISVEIFDLDKNKQFLYEI